MRVTLKSQFNPYLRNLQDIETRKYQNEVRISTGNDIINLSDSPERVYDIKKIDAAIERNKNYQSIVNNALAELRAVSDTVESVSNDLQNLRQAAIDATQVGNSDHLPSLGVYVKGMLEDLVKKANSDQNGKFLFSGTKTTSDSLTKTPPATNDMPFEIVEGSPTADNPSGLSVVFKGNTNARIINKDDTSTEQINVPASSIFGNGSTEVFDNIIKLYNVLTYNADGTARGKNDNLTNEDFSKINGYQQGIANINEQVFNTSSIVGQKLNRLQAISDQMTEEGTRLSEFRSVKSDTDVAKTSINLQLDTSALQYSLKVGAQVLQNSLFDYLA